MSTIKTDRLSSTHVPLPRVDGITEVELFVAVAGQNTFGLSGIDSSMQIRVFVDMDEATWNWVDSNIITVTAPTIPTGASVRVYKSLGELAYKNHANISDLVSDEALINAIIFG